MDRKHFTIEEANSTLPVVRKVVGTIQDRMKWLASNQPQIPYLVKAFRIPMDAPVPLDYFASLLQVRDALGEMDSLGCQIKDIQMGLVDFPSRLLGREVLLCWRIGEEAVEYYHDLKSGYSSRRPIPEDTSGSGGGGGGN